MDWADDIAYSVHDVDDFYRAGLIPLDRLKGDEREVNRFLDAAIKRRESAQTPQPPIEAEAMRETFGRFLELMPVTEPYKGTRLQRATLKDFNSTLITRYVDAVALGEVGAGQTYRLDINDEARAEIAILKELTWHYVINDPSLASQQYGQRKIIKDLFDILEGEANKTEDRDWSVFPPAYRERLDETEGEALDSKRRLERVRVVTDLISSMTEHQAIALHRRLMGASPGSLLDVMD